MIRLSVTHANHCGTVIYDANIKAYLLWNYAGPYVKGEIRYTSISLLPTDLYINIQHRFTTRETLVRVPNHGITLRT